MIKRLFRYIGIFHIIVAISCMLIGVIVEFHQVHIYKNNISFWHLMATKTTNKGSKKYVKPITDFVKDLSADKAPQDLQLRVDLFSYRLYDLALAARHIIDLDNPEYIYDKALRGPPCA